MAAPSTHFKNALRVDLRIQGKCAFLYLHGRLDNQFERIVLRAIESVKETGVYRVVVDCSGLSYLSSRGVSVFIAMIDELRAEGGDLKLAAVSDGAALVLDRLGVSKLIQRFSTTGEAMADFETPIELKFEDAGEILSVEQRSASPADLTVSPTVGDGTIEIPGLLLNPGDWFTVEVGLSSRPGAVPTAVPSGRIAGVREIQFRDATASAAEPRSVPRWMLALQGVFVALTIPMVLFQIRMLRKRLT